MDGSEKRSRAAADAAAENGDDHFGKLIEAQSSSPLRSVQASYQTRAIAERKAPAIALAWNKGCNEKAMDAWRVTVLAVLGKQQGVAIAVAWALEWLFKKHGFAFCTNKHLAKKSASTVKEVEKALLVLDRLSLIHRIKNDAIGRRRIYAALPASIAGRYTREEHGFWTLEDRAGSPASIAGHKKDIKGAAPAAPLSKIDDSKVPDQVDEQLPEFMRDDFEPDPHSFADEADVYRDVWPFDDHRS